MTHETRQTQAALATRATPPPKVFFCRFSSPLGELLLVARASPRASMNARNIELTGIYFSDAAHAEGVLPAGALEDRPAFSDLIEQLEAYFTGERTAFDLPLAPSGTPFQREVWRALTTIPFGETRTYGEIAKMIGRPRAFRAVGAANGKNPLSIVVPCHRVIGKDGTLTGYAGGMEPKRRLLALERSRG